MLYTKFQPNMPYVSREKDDFIGLAIFSKIGHFFILEQAEFHHSEASSCCT